MQDISVRPVIKLSLVNRPANIKTWLETLLIRSKSIVFFKRWIIRVLYNWAILKANSIWLIDYDITHRGKPFLHQITRILILNLKYS